MHRLDPRSAGPFAARCGLFRRAPGGQSASGTPPGAAPPAADAPGTRATDSSGWLSYRPDLGDTRYSPLARITPANVRELRVAWTFRTGELGKGVTNWTGSAFETTPILYNFTTPSTNVIAVDAATGVLRWRHESHNRNDLHYSDEMRAVRKARSVICHFLEARIFPC